MFTSPKTHHMAHRSILASAISGLLLVTLGSCVTPDNSGNGVVADSTSTSVVTNGPQVVHTTDGGRMEGDLKEAKRNGPWSSFFPNGGIRSKALYVDGLEEGPTEVFHENGMVYYTGQYRAGRSVGEWLFYDAKGALVRTVRYDSTGVMLDQH